MEIASIGVSSVRVKGKQASFAIQPLQLKTKTSAQAALFFNKLQQPLDTKHFEEEPVVIQGPGEYEINGVKITGNKAGDGYIYQMSLDGIDILIAKGSILSKAKESITECHMLVLDADVNVDQSLITALNPNIIVFFGEKKEENAKAFGQEAQAVSKYNVTKEKLPQDTQIVIL